MTLRQHRIENEWLFVLQLQSANPEVLAVEKRESFCGGDWFHIVVQQTGGLQFGGSGADSIRVHRVRVHFPEFFPAVPIEAYLEAPLLHPNIHPESGFVCLWDRFSPGDSIIETVRQLQRVVSWELSNREADHVMQPEAWEHSPTSPLGYREIEVPEDLRASRGYVRPPTGYRKRLS